jgi:hypothetical protein
MCQRFDSTFRAWRVALLLVAGALLSPQRASADCGSHVTVLNPTAESRQDAMPHTGAPTQPAKPCQGPNCSGAPERNFPQPAPPAPTSGPIKELVSGGSLFDRDDLPFTFERASTSARPIHRPLSVFHPPQAA